jgi:hypothetical protein
VLSFLGAALLTPRVEFSQPADAAAAALDPTAGIPPRVAGLAVAERATRVGADGTDYVRACRRMHRAGWACAFIGLVVAGYGVGGMAGRRGNDPSAGPRGGRGRSGLYPAAAAGVVAGPAFAVF